MDSTFRDDASDTTEDALLGILLVAPKLVEVVRVRGGGRLFYRESSRHIFRAMVDLSDDGVDVDAITVCDWLASRDLLDVCGGGGRVARLSSLVDSTSRWESYVRRLSERRLARELRSTAGTTADLLRNGSSATEVYAWLANRTRELAIPLETPSAADVAREVWDEVVAAVNGDVRSSFSFGRGWLDHLTGGGVSPGNSYYVGGLYKAGKTKVLGYMAGQLLDEGWTVDWWSVEMSAREMKRRHLSRFSGVPETRILDGKLSDDDLRKVQRTLFERLSDWDLRHFQRGRLNVEDVVAETAAKILTVENPDRYAVFVDYLQGCTVPGLTGHERVAEASQILNGISKEYGVPIFIAYQLAPREVERRGGSSDYVPMPRPSDARGSTQIVMDANELLVVHRPWWQASNDWRVPFTVVERQASRTGGSERVYLYADLPRSDYRLWNATTPDPFDPVETPFV